MRITTIGGERPAFGFCMWGAANSGTNAAQRYLYNMSIEGWEPV